MRLAASCSSAVRPALRAPAAEAVVLAGCANALYLRTTSDVLALVTPDALRLPCAVVSPSLPSAGPVIVGNEAIAWPGGIVSVVREWPPARVPRVQPLPARLAVLRHAAESVDIGLPRRLDLNSMLGRGPGLTPSGDDVLAGYLLGCRAFGAVPTAVEVYAELTTERTTALSAALLRHAIAGRCLPEVAAVVAALGSGDLVAPVAALLRVGHTSGAALGHGLLRAAA